MAKMQINGIKLKEAVEQFGTLQEAIKNLESKNEALEKEVNKRKQENHQLKSEKDKLTSDIDGITKQFDAEKKKIESVAANVGKWERQYNLFQGFIAMLLSSPAVDTSLRNLITLLEELIESGWVMTKTLDELRSHFVSTVMGDYLKCFRCKACGAKFMVNKEPRYKHMSNYYQCPSCHSPLGVEPDDSFLKAMISDTQLEDILTMRNIKKENDTLKPLAAFLSVTCEICGKPITEWDEHNVEIAVEKYGWGHTKCWNSDIGQLKLILRLEKFTQNKG